MPSPSCILQRTWTIILFLAMPALNGCNPSDTHNDTAQYDDARQQDTFVQPDDTITQPDAPPTPFPVWRPNPNEAPETIHIAIISDLNSSYGTIGYSPTVKSAVADIVRRRPDLVLCPGDMVAGQRAGLDYAGMWRSFHFQVADVFFDNGIEFVWAPGNHDASGYPAFIEERRAYARAWEARKPKAPLLPGSNFPFYYALRHRDILVVALDITTPFKMASEQLDWLDETLRREQDLRASFVLGHLPLEPVNWGQFWEIAGSPRLIDILQQRGVTFYISGHHHVFYAGHLGELRAVSAPALGANPRSIYGETPQNAYVWIEVPPHSPPIVTALIAPDFTRTIPLQSLPPRLLTMQREDLGMAHYIMEMVDAQARQAMEE